MNNPAGTRTWNDARDAELRRLWDLRWTASKIAAKLGVSRCSVIGRVHRLKLAKRPNPVKQARLPLRMPRGPKPVPCVAEHPARRGRPPVIRNRAQALKAEGRNVNEIAAELNTEREVVKFLLAGMTWARARAICRPKAPEPVKALPAAPKPAPAHRRENGLGACAWLDGEPRLRQFCAEPVKAGSSYCPSHHERCWQRRVAE